jgi:arylformamidase
MKPLYLSYFIDANTPVYGGSKEVIQIKQLNSIEKGDTSNNLSVHFPVHIGTHIDFPFHFSNTGKKSDDYPASFWVFNKIGLIDCCIDEVPDKINLLPSDIEILILKTNFGIYRNENRYWSQQPVIPASYADLFRSNFPKLRVFGFDMISLTSKLNRNEGKLAHINFLINNDILILEDMNLHGLQKTPDNIIIAPLQIIKADGVPCNVIAF